MVSEIPDWPGGHDVTFFDFFMVVGEYTTAQKCTPLCKSYGGDCINQKREEIVESDKEDLWVILVII